MKKHPPLKRPPNTSIVLHFHIDICHLCYLLHELKSFKWQKITWCGTCSNCAEKADNWNWQKSSFLHFYEAKPSWFPSYFANINMHFEILSFDMDYLGCKIESWNRVNMFICFIEDLAHGIVFCRIYFGRFRFTRNSPYQQGF